MIIKDLGAVTAYAAAVEKGYTGTEEEYAELMASYASVAEEAAESAESASTSATSASASAQTATTKASEASTSATQAGASATSASQSAQIATTKASEASASASTAGTKASEASASATTASTKASEASASATSAQTAQGLAESARDDAIDAKTDAESARDMAQQYAESIDPEHIYSAYPTDTAEGSIASFADGADDIPLKSLVVNIDPVQDLSQGDPSPTNICPISGWTGMTVNASGINAWDEEWEVGGIEPTNGRNNEQTNRLRSKNYIPCRPSTTYWFKKADNTRSYRTVYYDKAQTFIESSNSMSASAEFTTPGNCYFMRFFFMNPVYSGDISINYPSTDHDYHPYTGRAIAISLGQTVYGGKLDVLSGVLTVDRAMVTLSELFCAKEVSAYKTFLANPPEAMATSTNIALVQCSTWKGLSQDQISASADNYVWGSSSNGTIRIKSTAHENMTADEFKAAFADTQFVYKLATPIEIQLTPHEVKSFLGQNNIFADTGDTEVEYRADTKMYIERLTEPDADMIADANITSGSYFMVGNILYKATANIASGSAVIEGTNAIRKSLSEALNEINS